MFIQSPKQIAKETTSFETIDNCLFQLTKYHLNFWLLVNENGRQTTIGD